MLPRTSGLCTQQVPVVATSGLVLGVAKLPTWTGWAGSLMSKMRRKPGDLALARTRHFADFCRHRERDARESRRIRPPRARQMNPAWAMPCGFI